MNNNINNSFPKNTTMEQQKINIQFVEACEDGNLQKIKTLLNSGADLHYDDDLGLRSINYNKDKNFEIFSFLIEAGANVNCVNSCLVSLAAYNGNLAMLKYLKEKGADLQADNDAFITSCTLGHIDIVSFFIENGAKIKAKKNMAIRQSAGAGHLDVVKLLHSHGANIHSEKDNAFRNAAADGHLDVVEYLLKNGADINAKNGSALEYSIQNEHIDVIDYLLANQAQISSVNNSILKNAMRRDIKILNLLIQYGADINFENSYALQFAAEWSDIEKMEYFLSKGADLYTQDHIILKAATKNSWIIMEQLDYLYFLCEKYEDKTFVKNMVQENTQECKNKTSLLKHLDKLILQQTLNNELPIQSIIKNKLKL